MKTKQTDIDDTGILYIVSTPIGNLEDITFRALKTLKNVDVIAAESASHTKGLCNHYDIRTRLISYNQHNHKSCAPRLLKRLTEGENIALVTCAGTPALSDPGALLIKMACENGIKITPVPGASAALAALVACGLKIDKFIFIGFLSNKAGKRKKELKELADENKPIIFYEAPHRVMSFLQQLHEIFGNRYIVILRELTKAHEEILRGTVEDVISELSCRELKGEFTIITEGAKRNENEVLIPCELKDSIQSMLNSNQGIKDIATSISENYNISYRAAYKEALDLKREMDS
ncbi:MAG: 16S rRNA (cytidine(1402)-2'-O)-methyltransferase [Deltaproteobacteria bacterium]|nr:16S rRNA (cytidine(1402)-2'-O)-methyltransferase [Deltaproteobacteria bacterium]